MMVVVVSPTTEPAPPALLAATIAAQKPMSSRRLKTCSATVAPISAAAMLSRNEEITKTMSSSTKPPFQSSGSQRGRISGTCDFSNKRASTAKPSSRPNRFTRVGDSCRR